MENSYYTTQESVDEYIRLAKDVNSAELIEKLKSVLKPESSLLELGSGPGTDWELLSEHFKTTGSDFSMEFLNRLKNKFPQGKFLQLDAVSLETSERFDAIYSNKVLHHLRHDELVQSIKRQSELLADSGIICHSFWKGEGSEIFKGLYVQYHDKASLESLFTPYFELILLEEYEEFDQDDSLVLIAKRK